MAAELSPQLLAERGTVLEVVGTPGAGVSSTMLLLLAPLSALGPVAYLETRGAISPVAAAEMGCVLERLAFVHAPLPESWARALAYLIDGVRAIAAEVPRGVPPPSLRALAARARARHRLVALAPLGWSLPPGLTAGRIEPSWEDGRGSIHERRLHFHLEGKLAHPGWPGRSGGLGGAARRRPAAG